MVAWIVFLKFFEVKTKEEVERMRKEKNQKSIAQVPLNLGASTLDENVALKTNF